MRRFGLEEVQFVPSSFCSQDGRLFEWQGEIYRAIALERSAFYEGLFRDGIIDHLIDRRFLIDSKSVPISLERYGLVVQHRRVPFVSYPFEWCDQALKDSALFFLNLNLELLEFGLMAHDVHPWNILFEGQKPIFVDLCSIKPMEPVDFAKWIEQFHRFYLRPLYLFSTGQGRIARLCLQDWKDWKGGVLHEDFIRLVQQDLGRQFLSAQVERARRIIPAPFRVPLRPMRRLFTRLVSPRGAALSSHDDPESRKSILEYLANEVESIELPEILHWDYYEDLFTFPSFTDSQGWSPKHRGVANVLRMTKPSSVIDIGSNRGWYSQLVARGGANVIAIDKDEALVSILYRDAKCHSLSLQALIMDFLWPSPGFGLLNFWAPAVDRLRCEMAMALALVHHLVNLQGMQFHHIVEGLSKFTSRWLLTEFVSYEDPHLSTWGVKELEWYNLDNFLAALRREFKVVTTMESDPSTRILILCEK